MNNSPLQERRQQMNDLTQSELAAKTAVSQGVISSIEAGTRPLSFNTAERLSTYLDIPAAQLCLEHNAWERTKGDFLTCEAEGATYLRFMEEIGIEDEDAAGIVEFVRDFWGFKGNKQKASQVLNYAIESIPPAPSILLSNKQRQRQLAANQAAGERFRAQQEEESGEITPAPPILTRDKQPFEIKGKLEKRPGVILPTNPPLTTAQNEVEQIEAAPSILLAKPQKGGKNE